MNQAKNQFISEQAIPVTIILVMTLALAYGVPSVFGQAGQTIFGLLGTGIIPSPLSITRTLQFGSTDTTTAGEVTAWQDFLIKENKGPMAIALKSAFERGVAKGYFGNLTGKATEEWQASAGISPTAPVVGPKTRGLLAFNELLLRAAGSTVTPKIARIEPTQGIPGTVVTLTGSFKGQGNRVDVISKNQSSPSASPHAANVTLVTENATSISFTFPPYESTYYCDFPDLSNLSKCPPPPPSAPLLSTLLPQGEYDVVVVNQHGRSNPFSFSLTAKAETIAVTARNAGTGQPITSTAIVFTQNAPACSTGYYCRSLIVFAGYPDQAGTFTIAKTLFEGASLHVSGFQPITAPSLNSSQNAITLELLPSLPYLHPAVEEQGILRIKATPEYAALVTRYGSSAVSAKAIDYDGARAPFLPMIHPGFQEVSDCIILIEAQGEGYVYQLDEDLNIVNRITFAEFQAGANNVDTATMSTFYSQLK